MDRSAYYQQLKVALGQTRRKLMQYGIPLAPVNLSIIIAGFVIFSVVSTMVANLFCDRWACLHRCLSTVSYSSEYNVCALCAVLLCLP
jgi:hypothetical protein